MIDIDKEMMQYHDAVNVNELQSRMHLLLQLNPYNYNYIKKLLFFRNKYIFYKNLQIRKANFLNIR